MKRIFTIAILTFSLSAFAQIPTNGLIGHWPFNGNANDESGNSHNGTVNGSVALSNDRFGNPNQAYLFPGTSSDFIEISDHPDLEIDTSFSISFWFKRMPGSSIQHVISKGRDQNVSYFYSLQSSIHDFRFRQGGINYELENDTTGVIITGNWHHVVGVYDKQNTEMILYVDNIPIDATFAPSTLNLSNGHPLIFGRHFVNPDGSGGFEYPYTGYLDDVTIYGRALSQEEVTQLYSGCNFSTTIIANSSTTFCEGDNVNLASAHQGSPFTFQWLLNGASINGETNYDYTATTSGNYSVIVDSLGCVDTSNVFSVTVNPLPTVSVNSISSFINLYASPITLTGVPSGGAFTGNGVSVTSFNPNTAGLGTQTILYSYSDGNGCGNSASVSTIVYDTTGIVCTSYDTLTVNVYDTTYVTVTDSNYVTINDTAYISVTDTLIIDAVLTGITPPHNVNTIKIYPNPASTHIYIDNGDYSSMNGYIIKIDNSLSQTVFTSLIDQASFYIDLSTWSGNGLYFVYIVDNFGNTIETRKIVIQ